MDTNKKPSESEKLISTITEYIPTFFSPTGLLTHEKQEDTNLNITEIISQCELFFNDHPNTFTSEESKCSYIIHKLYDPAKKWGYHSSLMEPLRILDTKNLKPF